ncbi:sodium:calcium antiporter [Dongia sp.]|uniref:sodium:calcium antiporter n=1 Tax=Dongia sp. TaxID=1977262 RepID=UPI0035B0AC00
MGETAIWLAFMFCLGLIFVAGRKLSILADRLGDETGLGGSWIGVTLLSSVTSLPELITGFSSVVMADTPDIAIGDILGSTAFNVLLLVLIHIITWRQTPLFAQMGGRHVLPAAFGIVMLGLVAGELLLRQLGLNVVFLGIGPFVPAILIVYVVGIRMVFFATARDLAEGTPGDVAAAAPPGAQSGTVLAIAGVSVFVVAGGAALPFIGAELALQMGWNQSFVGTLLIAIATSAPEIAVTMAAARMGALDLAVGNVFGSNMFNMVILALDDILYRQGPLLAHVSLVHAVTAMTTLVMTGIAIAAMSYRRASGPSIAVGSMSLVLTLLYIGNAIVMFHLGF